MQFPCKSLWIKASAKWLNVNVIFFFCRILPLDRLICLWMSLSNQVTAKLSGKSRASNGSTPSGQFRAKLKSPQTSLIDSHVKSIFFTKQGSQCILYGFREGSPLHAFIISNERKSIQGRHTASTKAYSVEMASAQCNNSIISVKETPFSRRTNDKKFAKI